MHFANGSPEKIAADLYPPVFRTEFNHQGFALLNLGPDYGSRQQRRLMIDLKRELDGLEKKHRSRRLVYQSMGRFDQQVTTKPHRDGGPFESILMLGYEPTLVTSEVSIIDYSRCAFDVGISPAEFLDRFNPMFFVGVDKLSAYTTVIDDFDNACFQILLINNSMNPIGDERLVGVLHTASILTPNPALSRVVNSTMIASVPHGSPEIITKDQQADFASTTVIRKAADD